MTALWQAPAIFLSFVVWLASPPTGLADAATHEAFRRMLTATPAQTLVLEGTPPVSSVADASTSASEDDARDQPAADTAEGAAAAAADGDASAGASASGDHDETWWHDRMAAARAAVDQDVALEATLQTRINALTMDVASRDDPYQRARLQNDLQNALHDLDAARTRETTDRADVDRIQDDARRAGVPPGWVR